MAQPDHNWEALAGAALAAAQNHFLHGDHDRAIENCSTALNARPDETLHHSTQATLVARLYCQRGHARYIQHNLQAATEDYGQAIAYDPASIEAYTYRGLISYQTGKSIAAVADYSAAIALYMKAPSRGSANGTTDTPAWCLALAEAYFNRGNAQYQRHDFAQAIDDYAAALALHPGMLDALIYRGVARYQSGDGDGAASDYAEALQHPAITNLQRASIYYNRGLLLRQRGDLVGAIAQYDAALALQPKDADCLMNRGNARAESGDLPGAIEDYGAGLRLNPWIEDGFNIRGMARLAVGDLQGAEVDFSRMLARAPAAPNVYFNRGCARLQLGDLAGAIEDFSAELARRVPGLKGRVETREQRAEIYNNRGLAYHYQGNLAAAIDDYTRSIDQLRLAGSIATGERMASTLLNRGLAYRDQAAAALGDAEHAASLRAAAADLEQSIALAPAPALVDAARQHLDEVKRLRLAYA